HISLPAIAEQDEQSWYLADGTHLATRKAGDLLWAERLPQSFLDSQRVGMGSWAFNGQYQQRPAPLDGGLIKRQWVRFYRQLPEKFEFMVQSWDCTFSGGNDNDFVAGQVWARSGGKYFMLPYRTYERLDFGPTMAAIKSCHAKFPQAHAVLIEDKANGPAIISELQKEIPGVVAVNPEGGKLARAQATAPLWESGSIELPDPQAFGITWMEDYLHNMCAFPKAAHDDDVDATSQALIYMRSRLGGGIVEFYRRQATGEVTPGRSAKLAIIGASKDCGSQAPPPAQEQADSTKKTQPPGSPEPGFPDRAAFAGSGMAGRAGFARAEVEVPSPAMRHLSGLVLERSVLTAVAAGSQIQCNAKQYPAIRAALTAAAESKNGPQDEILQLLAIRERERLDLLFLNSAGHTASGTERPITQEINTTASSTKPRAPLGATTG
ncbi:MAG TPA: phage terminase large subunit, partial [Candidatus Acidoferrum sp.]|nr:phage terminase large subunit [Candidatus Acidoferrum sp.]